MVDALSGVLASETAILADSQNAEKRAEVRTGPLSARHAA
jgi:hypothetical protein